MGFGFLTTWGLDLEEKKSAAAYVRVAGGADGGKDNFGDVFRFKVTTSCRLQSPGRCVPSCFWVVPGLQNLGNNCFLNVVLQAMASCQSFRNHLWEMEEYGSLSIEEGD